MHAAHMSHVACRMLSIELEKKQKKKNNAKKYRKCGNKSLIILQTLLGFPKQHSISQKLSEIRQQICLQSPSKSNVHTFHVDYLFQSLAPRGICT